MATSQGLKELERRVWLRTFDHGLWDLAIGVLLLSFGVGILTEFFWLSAIVAPLGVPTMRDLARRTIVPRIGHATFRGRRKRSMVHIQLVLAGLAIMGLVMFLFTAFATRDAAPDWAIWVRSHFVVVIGLIWGGALGVAGWAIDFPRLYAYGAVLFGALLAVDLWPTGGYHLGHALIAVGGLIALIGVGLFIHFLRRYPRHAEPAEGAPDG